MSQMRYTPADAAPPAGGRTFDADLNFLSRWAGPLGLLARAMLAYIFIIEGAGKIASYTSVAGYMQAHGVDGRLLPLVVLTELGGGLLVLFGLKTRWAAIALFGFCLLTAVLPHRIGSDHRTAKERRHGRRLPYACNLRPRPLVARRLARSRRLGSPDSITVPGQPDRAADFTPKPGRTLRRQLAKPTSANDPSLRIAVARVSAANVRFLASAGQLRRLGFDPGFTRSGKRQDSGQGPTSPCRSARRLGVM